VGPGHYASEDGCTVQKGGRHWAEKRAPLQLPNCPWSRAQLSISMLVGTRKETGLGRPCEQSGDISEDPGTRPDVLTKSSWVLCPVNAVRKIFSTNLSSESSSFNELIN